MQILLIILYREDLLDEVLTALVEMEITGASVLDGTSMERVLWRTSLFLPDYGMPWEVAAVRHEPLLHRLRIGVCSNH